MSRILTIQDISCIGQCSVTVALPIISSMGVETSVLPSAVLSTHTGGFSGYTYRDLTEDIPSIARHWVKENQKFEVIYTGYIGKTKQLEYISDLVDSCMIANGKLIVDPVMGDNGKLYPGISEDFAYKMREFCAKADIIIPNLTETSLMLGIPFRTEYDKEYIEDILVKLAEINHKQVVLTGVSFEKNKLGIAIYDYATKKAEYYFNDKIGGSYHGTGDVFASVLVGAVTNGFSLYEAGRLAADFAVKAIECTDKNHWYGVCFEKAIPFLVDRIR